MDKQLLLTRFRMNKLARFMLYPVNLIYRKRLLTSYHNSYDSTNIRQYKNIHYGKRCFVIGNGPSLFPDDLDKIKNEYCFASNRIYHIYSKTKWRPSYYVSIDNNYIDCEIERIKQVINCTKFINYHAVRYGRNDEDNIIYICTKGKFRINPYDSQVSELSDDISDHVSWVHSVSVTSIEIAIYMGFKEIYLLGMDNDYAKKITRNGKVYDDPNVVSSYFEGMKDYTGQNGAGPSYQNVDAVNYSFSLAKMFAKKHGVVIRNATRGGKLEIFDRVNIEDLME